LSLKMAPKLLIFLVSFSVGWLLVMAETNKLKKGVSNKKGLCIPPRKNAKFYCGDLEAFSRVGWWYNWAKKSNYDQRGWCTCEAASHCGQEPETPEFVPMVWGMGSMHHYVDDKYATVLGFNEPNHRHQANLSPEVAAKAWIEFQNMYPDRILVSPAPAGGGIDWLDKFFEYCDVLGCRVDYVATHDYRGDADKVMARLEQIYNRYGRKVWLTEFAKCCTRNQTKIEQFAKEIIPRLEAADFVYRYAWFKTRFEHKNVQDIGFFVDEGNALFDESGELSNLGRIYDSL